MKKRIALVLAMALSASMVFSACGQKADETAATDGAKEEAVDENGNKVYIDAWPAWLDIENLIYRPALQHIIPFILAFILRIFDRMADHAVSIIRRTILKEIEPHRPLLYGNIFTHAVGMAMDGLEKLLNNTVRKKNPKNVNYEKKLALSAEQLIKTARLTSRSVSFGLMMFSLGCILTLIYLIYVLVINMM